MEDPSHRREIKLSEEEVWGYWGPGVFVTIEADRRAPWFTYTKVAYWAG